MIDQDLVAAALKLTPAESRVAVMLATGHTVRAVGGTDGPVGEHGALAVEARSSASSA